MLVLFLLIRRSCDSLALRSFNKDESSYSFYRNPAVRAPAGIVLLISVYLVHQQRLTAFLASENGPIPMCCNRLSDLHFLGTRIKMGTFHRQPSRIGTTNPILSSRGKPFWFSKVSRNLSCALSVSSH